MIKHLFVIVSLIFTSANVFSRGKDLPENQFAHIQTDGYHIMLSDTLNRAGHGEKVNISKDYYMALFAVTNEEWETFLSATHGRAPRYWKDGKAPAGKENHPVVWVSYEDALAYCAYLETVYPEYDFRLPTQAEWEYAAAGTSRAKYPWGNNSDVTYRNKEIKSKFNYNAVFGAFILKDPEQTAVYYHPKSSKRGQKEPVKNIFSIQEKGQLSGWINHRDYTGFVYTDLFKKVNDAGGFTCAVDSYPDGVSPFGCYNMSGNCWEWTSTVEKASNGAEKGQMVNIIKGGSWYATARSCTVSYRGEGRNPRGAYATVGFRVVAEKK